MIFLGLFHDSMGFGTCGLQDLMKYFKLNHSFKSEANFELSYMEFLRKKSEKMETRHHNRCNGSNQVVTPWQWKAPVREESHFRTQIELGF